VQATSEGATTVETTTEAVEAARLLLRPEEVAQALGVGRTTVFELIRAGELRSVKIGKSRRIPTEAAREYVAGLGG
jgi:excisionase family DNA binding protein